MMRALALSVVLLATTAGTLTACSTSPAELTGSAVSALSGGARPTAGFHLEPSASLFPIGAVLRTERAGSFTRLVGENGAVATTVSGATISLLDADKNDVFIAGVGPFTRDPAEHEAKVRQYFADRGLAAEQVDGAQLLTLMKNSGSIEESPAEKPATFLAFTTVLHRRAGGVPVEGSHAWASFNAAGAVVAEEVFWPELPSSVLTEALEAQEAFKDPKVAAVLLAKTGAPGYGNGVVKIHHSPLQQDAVAAVVAVDFYATGLEDKHLTIDGKVVRFPWESVTADPAPKKSP